MSAWWQKLLLVFVAGVQLFGCVGDQTVVIPKPLLEEQINTVPLLYPGAPLAEHSLGGVRVNKSESNQQAWNDWLMWLKEPPLVKQLTPLNISSGNLEQLRIVFEDWLQWLNKQANDDNVVAQVSVGMLQQADVLHSETNDSGQFWLSKAAAKGNGFAAWQLARSLLQDSSVNGPARKVDPAVLEKWLLLAAEKNIPQAPVALARLNRDGFSLVQNVSKSRQWYEELTAQNKKREVRINAWQNLGLMDWFGIGKKANETSAVAHWKRAIDFNDPQAAYLTALSKTGLDVNTREHYLKLATRKGIYQAYNQLGLSRWSQKEYTSAVSWFEYGDKVGDAKATYNLGRCYFEGLGRSPNAHKALINLYHAAGAGRTDANRLVGFLFWQGAEGGPVDFKKARQFFSSAAGDGDLYSLYALGLIYGVGQGVPRDLIVAWSNFSVVAAWGFHEAATLRDLVASHMTEAQREAGRSRAQTLFDNYRQLDVIQEITRQIPPVAVSLVKPKA
ncbi:tetratricopeptide repeat protein [Parendozoicomonas sp. Alg238-R29]|uniref:tetratricopeptide repeat protein n=1 Tax=Parendozoicomonas sp. Alg238-R29 TaxID=2993446 RepID=UPI00248EE149|nr:tetratricopeptide repeat protein [Parendozoicomonas sp. Alg238-R29]